MEFPPKVLRRVLFVAAPIVVFLSDFVSFRSVFENRQETQTVNLMSFVAAGKTRLGVYRAHQLYVSLDDVASPYFLADLAKARNALLVSAFKHEDGTISVAALGSAVLKRLRSISESDYHRILDQWSSKSYVRPGEVLISELHLTPAVHASFPVDNLYAVIFEAGDPIDGGELSEGLITAIHVANERGIENMIVPCLGRSWEYSVGSYANEYDTFFPAFFSSIQADNQSPAIYLSLYKNWPSFELENAIGRLNDSWGGTGALKDSVRTTRLYREKYRTTMLAWFSCLLVCSFFVFPGLKNLLIISTAYLGTALGSDTLVDFLTQGRPSLNSTLHYVVLGVLAIGFPIIVLWDPKDLFRPQGPAVNRP